MKEKLQNAIHPGAYVRNHVIPQGMSVTEAARKLSVGRPALSNFLNGKSSLSHRMAVSLQKAFDADSNDLLMRQTQYEKIKRVAEERAIPVARHVPTFLEIKAREIHNWPDNNLEARQLLPVLIY